MHHCHKSTWGWQYRGSAVSWLSSGLQESSTDSLQLDMGKTGGLKLNMGSSDGLKLGMGIASGLQMGLVTYNWAWVGLVVYNWGWVEQWVAVYYSVKTSSQQAQQEIACSVKTSNLVVVILFRVKDRSTSNSRGSVVACSISNSSKLTTQFI